MTLADLEAREPGEYFRVRCATGSMEHMRRWPTPNPREVTRPTLCPVCVVQIEQGVEPC